jgi:hypothetical protein
MFPRTQTVYWQVNVYTVTTHETATSSTAVAGHYSAVRVRMSLLDEVNQPTGIGGLSGRAGPAVAPNHFRKSHCGHTNNCIQFCGDIDISSPHPDRQACLKDLSSSQQWPWGMPSSGMWRRVVLEEQTFRRNVSTPSPCYRYIIPRSLIFSILMMGTICSSETSFLIRATQRQIPDDEIFKSTCNLNNNVKLLRNIRFSLNLQSIFYDITPCSLLKINWRFVGIRRLHLATCIILVSCLDYS